MKIRYELPEPPKEVHDPEELECHSIVFYESFVLLFDNQARSIANIPLVDVLEVTQE